MFRTKL